MVTERRTSLESLQKLELEEIASLNKQAGKIAAASGVGAGLGVLIAELLRGNPAKAAEGGNVTFGLDDATRAVLAQMALDISASRQTVAQILALLGQTTPQVSKAMQLIQFDNVNLLSGQPYKILDIKGSPGSLMWILIDLQTSNADVTFLIDNLLWKFNVAQMIQEGLMLPMYPGAWITRADPIGPPPTFSLLFSAGTVNGFEFKNALNISVTNNNPANSILNHTLGVQWIYS